jgi:uncharacterized membrane protein YeiH
MCGDSKPAWFTRYSHEMTPEINSQFRLPMGFDLGATFLYALTGALVAIRRHYDIIGLFVLAAVSGLGGGLIRDAVFIENGPPLALRDERYLYAVIAGCLAAALFSHRMDRLQKGFLLADALGLGAYAVVGVSRALGAGLPELTAITAGIINASGGGLLRDVLVREEPLLFKPGQLYVLAALLGAGLFTLLVVRFARPVESSGLLAVGGTFAFRLLAIKFNWKTGSVARRLFPTEPEPGTSPGVGASAIAGKTDSAPASPPPPQKGQSPSDGHEPEK